MPSLPDEREELEASGRRELAVDEAIAMLPQGDRVHTLRAGFGCNWPRADIEAELRTARRIRTTNGYAKEIGHGIALETERGNLIYVETV